MNITNKRQINRRKNNAIFYEYFMCTGVHRREMILKYVVRLKGLYTTLTKVGVFGLQRMINHEEVTKKYMGEIMGEDKGYFSKICLCRLILVSNFCLG